MGYQIISVTPNCEASVCHSLDLYGLKHEWFRVQRKVVYRGRLVLRTMPLFPGYLFVLARYMWQLIERIDGVRGFVRFGGSIEDIPIQVVSTLRSRADADGVLTELPFSTGQPISVRVGGQWTAGTFGEFVGPARATVRVPMFGRVVCMHTRLGEIRALG